MSLIESKYNPNTGVTVEYHANVDGSVTVRQFQDVEDHFKSNKIALNANSSKSRHSFTEGLGREVGQIPFGMIPVIKEMTGINPLTATNDQLKHILNNRDFSNLRTGVGTL